MSSIVLWLDLRFWELHVTWRIVQYWGINDTPDISGLKVPAFLNNWLGLLGAAVQLSVGSAMEITASSLWAYDGQNHQLEMAFTFSNFFPFHIYLIKVCSLKQYFPTMTSTKCIDFNSQNSQKWPCRLEKFLMLKSTYRGIQILYAVLIN